MASIEEMNHPIKRWEEEDEDFLDREENYVLQKSNNAILTNVTAKNRKRHHGEKLSPVSSKGVKANGDSKTSISSSSSKMAKEKRKSSSSSSRKKSNAMSAASKQKAGQQAASATNNNNHASAKQKRPPPPLRAERSAPISAKKTTAQPPAIKTAMRGTQPRRRSCIKEADDDADSLTLGDIFPDAFGLNSLKKDTGKEIYIPVKQEPWNDSIMYLHESTIGAAPVVKYMKEETFDDDDKSLTLYEIFPVLGEEPAATKKVNPKHTKPTAPQQEKKPASLAAAIVAAARKQEAAEKAAIPRKKPVAKKPETAAAAAATAPNNSTRTQESSAKTPDSKGNKAYQLPTYVQHPPQIPGIPEGSDELTMDSALQRELSERSQENSQKRKQQEKQQVQLDSSRRGGGSRALTSSSKKKKKSSKHKKERSDRSRSKSKPRSSSRKSKSRELEESDDLDDRRHLSSKADYDSEDTEARRERHRRKKEKKRKKELKKKKKRHKESKSERPLRVSDTDDASAARRRSRSLTEFDVKADAAKKEDTADLTGYLNERERTGSRRSGARSVPATIEQEPPSDLLDDYIGSHKATPGKTISARSMSILSERTDKTQKKSNVSKKGRSTYLQQVVYGENSESDDGEGYAPVATRLPRVRSSHIPTQKDANYSYGSRFDSLPDHNASIKPQSPKKDLNKRITTTSGVAAHPKAVRQGSNRSNRGDVPLSTIQRMDSIGRGGFGLPVEKRMDGRMSSIQGQMKPSPAESKKKSRNIFKRLFSRRSKVERTESSGKGHRTSKREERSTQDRRTKSQQPPKSRDQRELEAYLSNSAPSESKSSWDDRSFDEDNKSLSQMSSPVLALPDGSGMKHALGTPPGSEIRDRLGRSNPEHRRRRRPL